MRSVERYRISHFIKDQLMERPSTIDSPENLHPWVLMTEKCLNKIRPGDDGLIRPGKVRRLNACVGKDSVRRSMLIWDHILKAVEAGKFKIRMEKVPPCRTIVTVDGEELSIFLKEKLCRREHVPTLEEKERAKGYTHIFQPPKWDHLPSGKLVLTIDFLDADERVVNEVTWTDGEKKRIEDRVASFTDVLMDVAKDLKEGRVKAAEWRRQREEERRQEREARRLRVQEKKRVRRLKKQVSAWKQAVSMRRFIHAVRGEATRRHGQIAPGSPLDKWLQWAEGQADRSDPIPALLMDLARDGKEALDQETVLPAGRS